MDFLGMAGASCATISLDRLTPLAISLANRFACPTTRLVAVSSLP